MATLITQPSGDASNPPLNLDLMPAGVFERNDPLALTRQIGRAGPRAIAESGEYDPETGVQITTPQPRVDPDALNQKYSIEGPTPGLSLHFSEPLPDSVASEMAEAKRDEIARANANARTPSTWGTVLGNLGVGFLDPIGLAASVLPVVGEARVASVLGAAGLKTIGNSFAERTLLRTAAGAASGASAMAPIAGLHLALAGQEGEDYHMWDAAKDVAFGAALGGIMHPLTGAAGDMSDWLRGRLPGAERPVDADRAAMHAATAAVMDDSPVNVAPMLDAAPLGSAYAARLRSRGDTGEGNYTAFTGSGMSVELRPEVVDAGSLVASNDDSGAVNPAYPAEMQPRDRTAAASQAQVTEMASRLEPERLGPSPEAANGAPIVNADGVVESGNGRVMALRRVYNDPQFADQATAYRAYLEARGFDTSGMTAPVLIGRRVTDLSPDELRAFTRGANERTTLDLNASEQAKTDTARVAASVDAWKPGPLDGPANEDFVRAFMRGVPAEERAGMILADGRLSGEGLRRMRGALLGYAYGDQIGPTLERLLNGDVEHMRGLAGALSDVAPRWGQMRAAAARGEIPAGMDITPALGEAVRMMDDARRTRKSLADVLSQVDAFNPPDPQAIELLRLMHSDEAMKRPLKRADLAALLQRYADQAMDAKPGPNLFGEPETSPADVLGAIAKTPRPSAVDELAEGAARTAEDRAAGGDAAGIIKEAQEAAKAPPSHQVPAAPVGDLLRPSAPAAPAADDPEIAKLAPEQATKLHALYASAAAAKPGFDADLSSIAANVGGRIDIAKLKGTPRAVAKIISDYDGNASRIKDLLRATIEVETPDQASAALANIETRMKVLDTGKRDWINGDPGADGYRDIKVNVDMGGGLVAEVQINLTEMLKAKKQAHALYEERSALERRIFADGHRDPSPEEQAEIDDLNARQKVIYDAAFEASRTRATNAQKAASDIQDPLRRAEPGSNGRGGSVSQAAEYPGDLSGLNADGTSAKVNPSETGISPSISKNSAIEGPPDAVGSEQSGSIKAMIPAQLSGQIDALAQQFAEARAAGLLDGETQAELASIADAEKAADSSMQDIAAATLCLFGGLT